MNILIIILTIINSVAMVVIAYFAYVTHQHNKKSQQELSDLYQAIVISTIMSGPGGCNGGQIEACIKKFKTYYDGDTKISLLENHEKTSREN